MLLFLLAGIASTAFAQYNIRLRIVSKPTIHSADSIFGAGNFNDWQPDKTEFSFSKTGDTSEQAAFGPPFYLSGLVIRDICGESFSAFSRNELTCIGFGI